VNLAKRRDSRQSIFHAMLVATDAACGGLNSQTRGTLVNVDLPWNPSKLEQRIGRIKRFGQVRDRVDMLSLVYQGSRDEVVYDKLSECVKERFDIFGQLPDTLDDEWIENEETLVAELNKHADRRKQVSAFDVRWGGTATGEGASYEQRIWQQGGGRPAPRSLPRTTLKKSCRRVGEMRDNNMSLHQMKVSLTILAF
jgi:superfamily II DNA/RNA helicase